MEVVIARDGFDLVGELMSPTGDIACGLVMVGGSGPSDRLNGGYFEPIRNRLVETGIAVLSYDKRGVGASGGAWAQATLHDFADDASAAIRLLRAAIPPSAPVAMYGHSEGGWVTLIAAAAVTTPVDRIITTSCPALSPAAQDRYAVQVDVDGSPDGDDVLAAYDRFIAADDYASAAEILSGTRRLHDLLGSLSEDEWAFLARKKHYNPMRDAAAVTCPWLAVYGSADRLVPVTQTVTAFADFATVETFPGADHRLQVNGALAPHFLDTVTQWLLAP